MDFGNQGDVFAERRRCYAAPMCSLQRKRNVSGGFLSVILFAFLCGCGGGPSSNSQPAPSSMNSLLAGNWLIYGSLPEHPGLSLTPTGSTNPSGFALSINVNGDQITAGANLQTSSSSCGIFSATFGSVLTGPIAPDGTFAISSPTSSTLPSVTAITVQGTVPVSADAPWKGTYSLSSTSPSFNNSPPCNTSQSGAFTATAVQDVAGTFAGAGSFGSLGNPFSPASTPVSLNITLQQGGTLYSPRVGAVGYSRLALSGAVQIGGISCFTKGTTSTSLSSLVEGNKVVTNFVAEDGTTAEIVGEIIDTEATHLSIDTIAVRGSQCNAIYEFLQSPLTVQK